MAESDEGPPGATPFVSAPEFPPPSTTVKVEFGAQSRRGLLHPVNEDHYLVIRLGRSQETVMTSLSEDLIPKRFDEYGHAMVVADGMGGTGAGEVASRLAIETLMHLILHFSKWNMRIDTRIAQEVMDRALSFYRHVDSAVVHRGRTDGDSAFQTTLTAVFGAGRDLFFAHVGHSRAYLFRNGELMRLTRDHTLGGMHKKEVPRAPLLDINTAARDLKHILTDTVGMGGSSGPLIDLERFALLDRDRVLVCTNGLTDMVEEEIIAETLASDQSPDDQCRTLAERAMTGGGADDVTVLVARYHVPERSERPQ